MKEQRFPLPKRKEKMNIIKFEFFKNNADIASADYDNSEILRFIFPTSEDGYLSIGPRIIKVEGGTADINLKNFSDGVQGCYLCIEGKRFELPSLDKIGRYFRMANPSVGSAMARVNYLKELECRLEKMEERLLAAEEKIYGRRTVI